MSPKGTHNHVIRAAIKAGLRLEHGDLILPSGRVFNGGQLSNGYHRVTLRYNGRAIGVTRGRVVCWLAHGEPPTPQHQADHINGIRNDDRPGNLRWATPSQNTANVSEAERLSRVARMKAKHDEVKRLRAAHAGLVAALEESVNQMQTMLLNSARYGFSNERINMTSAALVQARDALQSAKASP